MDVRQLAPALLAIGDLFERSNALLNENRAHVSVRVTAAERGSFILHIDLWQTVAEQVKALIGHVDVATINTIIDSLFGKAAGTISVFQLIRLLRGKRAKRKSVLQNGNVQLELPDGTTAEAKPETVTLYEDQRIRQDAADAIKPLGAEGIDSLEVRRGQEVLENVSKPEIESFQKAAEKPDYRDTEPKLTANARRAVEIIKPSFADDLVWTVSGGDGERFTAKMVDPDFQSRVDSGDVFFKKGDIAIVEVTTKSWVVNGRLHSEHEITKVQSFEHGTDQQLDLPSPPPPAKE